MKKKIYEHLRKLKKVTIRKTKVIKKNFFLNYFFESYAKSKKTIIKTKHSDFFPRFKGIKEDYLCIEQQDLKYSIFNLLKNQQYLKHLKKNKFFTNVLETKKELNYLFKKQPKKTFIKFYLGLNSQKKILKDFIKHPINRKIILTKMNFNSSFKLIKKEIFLKNNNRSTAKVLKQKFSSLDKLLVEHKIDFLKINYLWSGAQIFIGAAQILFVNKQIRRFIYVYLFSKSIELSDFSRILKFFLNFLLLDFFVLNLFFNSLKKLHLNNSNAWIFKKYWLFLEPFPYFFSNELKFLIVNSTKNKIINLKKIFIQHLNQEFFSFSQELKQRFENSIFNQTILIQYLLDSFEIFFSNLLTLNLNYSFETFSFNQSNKKKNLILKTYYLGQYKLNLFFKSNLKKKKYNFTSSINLKFKKIKFKFYFIAKKNKMNIFLNLKKVKYRFLKFI